MWICVSNYVAVSMQIGVLNTLHAKDAEDMALSLVMKGAVGLKGRGCTYNVVVDEE